MPLNSGDRIGPYEVLAPLGAGGMGEVYRARDTKLQRDVALKGLPAAFAADPERLARFEREARTLAALNHPYIAQIYGLEESGPSTGSGQAAHPVLVMELVEGEDLAARIARGPIPLEEAMPLARQIAEALEAAHEAGIIHRDLKPANIKVRPDGTVKVLDFGLARAADPSGAGRASGDLANSPTITSPALMTMQGIILGTAAYMSPEQAKGKPVDRRADIWAFGCVLYEMLTGRRAFHGEDVTDTIVATMSRDADWSALPPATPASVRRLLARCLTKDVRLRLRDIGDARPDLSDDAPVVVEPARRRSPVWLGIGMAGAGVALGLLLAALGRSWLVERVPPPVTRFSVVAPPHAPIALDAYSDEPVIAMSRDGSRLVYSTPPGPQGGRLMVRSANSFETTELAGLGATARHPFLSPKGDWIGYHLAAGEGRRSFALAKIPVAGGSPAVITDIVGPLRGARWTDADEIVYATGFTATGLLRTRAAAGSKEEVLTSPKLEDGEVDHVWPDPLPDGKHVLFTIRRRLAGEFDVALLALETRTWRVLIRGGTAPRYLPTGHIAYATPGRLHVAGFDLNTLALTTEPRQVIDGIVTKSDGAADYDVAEDGTLVYVPGRAMTPAVRFSWATPSGPVVPIGLAPGAYRWSALSPDGQFIATSIGEDTGAAIFVADLTRDMLTRLTPPGLSAMGPVWSRDGVWVAFFAQPADGAPPGIFRVRASGAAQPERITTSPSGMQYVESWSPDGQHLFYVLPGAGTGGPSLRRVTFTSSGIEDALVSEWAADPRVSPDGRWLAHINIRATPNFETEIRPFPNWSDARVVVSAGGGEDPVWSNDGREIYYSAEGAIFAVSVDDTNGLRVGRPRKLFEGLGRLIGIAPDGRFLFLDRTPDAEQPRASELRLVFNWFEELRSQQR